MNFTQEEITLITKVLIRQLMQDEGALAQLQQELADAKKEKEVKED